MSLPQSFVDLNAAYNSAPDTPVNIIGIVVDYMPPKLTNGGDHMMTFKLLDPHTRDSIWNTHGISVRFFKRDPLSLPRIQQLGDIVLLRKMKMIVYNQQPLVLSNHQSENVVFPGKAIPAPNFEIAYRDKQRLESLGVPLDVRKLTLEEQHYVIQLKHDMNDTIALLPTDKPLALPANVPTEPAAMRKRPGESLNAPSEAKVPRLGKKFKLVHQLQHFDFADMVVQVVKKFPNNFGACDLYVTDYTENKELFYYAPPEDPEEHERDGDRFSYMDGSKKSWPGPFGQLTLQIELRDPHAHYANSEVNEGDFVLLRNVRMKTRARLEGSLWADQKDPAKVQINRVKKLDWPEIEATMERKERYWKKRQQKFPDTEQQPEKKLTKTQRKKEKKLRAAGQAADATKVLNGTTINGKESERKVATKIDINPHVRCSNDEVPIRSIKGMLETTNALHTTATPDGTEYILPFVNVRYRTRVRVVDFEPKQLEDFALPEQPDDHAGSEGSPVMEWESTEKYEWSFSLQLEDAPRDKKGSPEENRLWVNVDHQDAQYLFGNDVDDPCDLRNDPRLLAKLREKLCILWGNLEEKREDEPISNRSFECCIAEYGVEDTEDQAPDTFGFKPMYKMFGVTIL